MKEEKGSQTTFKCLVSKFTPNDSNYLKSDYDFRKVVQMIHYYRFVCKYLKISSSDKTKTQRVFIEQLERYMKPSDKVIVLSAFPQFALDLFGTARIGEVAGGLFVHLFECDLYKFKMKDLSMY